MKKCLFVFALMVGFFQPAFASDELTPERENQTSKNQMVPMDPEENSPYPLAPLLRLPAELIVMIDSLLGIQDKASFMQVHSFLYGILGEYPNVKTCTLLGIPAKNIVEHLPGLKSLTHLKINIYKEEDETPPTYLQTLSTRLIFIAHKAQEYITGTPSPAPSNHRSLSNSAYELTKLKHLQYLDASMRIKEKKDIAPLLSCLPPSLTSLDLSETWEFRTPKLQNLPHLERLNLSECYNLCDPHLQELTSLQILNLSECAQLIEENLDSEHLPSSLTTLIVSKCKSFENVQLELPHLQSLNLSECEDLQAVNLSECPNLTTLDLSWCSNLQEKSLVRDTFPSSLTSLDLSGCSNSSRDTVEALRKGGIQVQWGDDPLGDDSLGDDPLGDDSLGDDPL